MVFKSTNELKSYLLSKMESVVQEAEEKVYKIIDKILSQWYREYDPVLYVRTYQLLHSLVKSEVKPTNNGYEAKVYFDASLLDYSYKYLNGEDKYFHDAPSGEDVMQAAMYGKHGAVGWNIATTTTPIWGESMKMLKNNSELFSIIKKALILNGIPVK